MSRRTLFVALALCALAVALGGLRWRLIERAPMLAIVFDHQDHFAVKCATCHHNFFDRTGNDSCYFCHKQRPELARRVQTDFHTLCRDCHTKIAAQGYASGPTRRCSGCHDWRTPP